MKHPRLCAFVCMLLGLVVLHALATFSPWNFWFVTITYNHLSLHEYTAAIWFTGCTLLLSWGLDERWPR